MSTVHFWQVWHAFQHNMQVIYILQLVLTEGYWRQAKSAREGHTWGPVRSADKQSSWPNPSCGPEGPLWQNQENRRVTRWPRHKWYSCCKAFRLFPWTLPVRRLAVQSHLSCDWYLEVIRKVDFQEPKLILLKIKCAKANTVNPFTRDNRLTVKCLKLDVGYLQIALVNL